MRNMRDDWIAKLQQWAAHNPHVRELWLFGSRAKGEPQPDSDVDIAVLLMPGTLAALTYTDCFDEWKDALRAIVGTDVSLEPIGPGFPLDSEVRSTGVLLWSRD